MHDKLLIFTDLDGSLLNHYTYSFSAARPMLFELEQKNVPVIPVSSKTRAELINTRKSMENEHPFIVENGAAVFIPQGYFKAPPEGTCLIDGFHCQQFSKPRETWVKIINAVRAEFDGEFTTFTELGTSGISSATGLSKEKAELANLRDFSEPVQWLGTESRKTEFVDRLKRAGATVLRGGRFLHITGEFDKGTALRWLTEQYTQEACNCSYSTIGIGDSHNDISMLEAADKAIIIRSHVHPPPEVDNACSYVTLQYGPEGWAEGVHQLTGFTPPYPTISFASSTPDKGL